MPDHTYTAPTGEPQTLRIGSATFYDQEGIFIEFSIGTDETDNHLNHVFLALLTPEEARHIATDLIVHAGNKGR